jgi:hypothetical protein
MSDAPEYAIESGWLVEVVKEHTCGAGDGMYGHEPGCGLIPIAKVDDLLAAEAKLAAARLALAAFREVRDARDA